MFVSQKLIRAGLLATLIAAAACSPACSADDAAGPRVTHATQPAPAPSAQPAGDADGDVAPALTAEMVQPYFADLAASEQLAREDWQAARDGFAAYLAEAHEPPIDDTTRARARLLMAIADTHLDAWSSAAEGFAFAAERLPLIDDYIYYQAARAYYFAHEHDIAMRYTEKVAARSLSGANAELLAGDILRGAERWAEMSAHYERYLSVRPSGIRRAEARYRLAQALDRQGKDDAALRHYRVIAVRAPLSSWAEHAQARMDELLAARPAAERARFERLSNDELLERGMVYFRAMRNPLSERDFDDLLARPDITVEMRCVASYHRAQSVFKARDRKRAAPLFDQAISDCEQAGNTDLQVKAAYQAGRSYAFERERQSAIDRYRRAETISPSHTYVDDARLRQAEEYASLGDDAEVSQLLSSIPEKYPEGDMRAEALWRLGWRAYQDGEYERAVEWFQKQIAAVPIDHNWWAEGQAQYWQGRTLDKLGKPGPARAAYRDAVLRYPLSYYALLALNRLRESHPKSFSDLVDELRAQPDASAEGPAAGLKFGPRPEYSRPGFARALEFLRLGLGDEAGAELRRLGMSVPNHRRPLEDPDQIEKLWATAFLYDRAGRYSLSHWPTRWHLLDYKRHWPQGAMRARWEIAYPRGFWPLLAEHANKNGFPPELIIAIVREESAFNPTLESYANAIGLTQMIFPTARRFANGTGIDVSRETLRDPVKNVTIGSRFLGFLWTKWDQFTILIPPSYNAGENAVARWLRERGHLAADEFIESIAGDQARRYSKRVLSSFFVYSYLYKDEIPTMPNTIPSSLLP
ncbi:MAG: tetratricopeptide repeat protein [Haliangiales bacterium]